MQQSRRMLPSSVPLRSEGGSTLDLCECRAVAGSHAHVFHSQQLASSNMAPISDASNMPQIWGLVAGDNSALTKPHFYSTLRLISLAQASTSYCPLLMPSTACLSKLTFFMHSGLPLRPLLEASNGIVILKPT